MIVVDRIEGEVAVVEIAGVTTDIPLSELPPGVKEGDQLVFSVVPRSAEDEAKARLERLRSTTPQGPGSFDL
jgi:hypothetical protein